MVRKYFKICKFPNIITFARHPYKNKSIKNKSQIVIELRLFPSLSHSHPYDGSDGCFLKIITNHLIDSNVKNHPPGH